MAETTERRGRGRPRLQVTPPAPMEFAELELIRHELGTDGRPLPYAVLARALGYADASQLFRWRKGDTAIPGPTAKLLRVFRDLGMVY
jgi:DNA-binding transcriptional regulator YiaG